MTATKVGGPQGRSALRRKRIGLAFLGVPVAVIVLFAVGEGIGAEPGWWGHLVQLAVAGGLAVGAWYRPRIGGPVLIAAGVALTVLVLASNEMEEWVGALSTIAIIAAPLIIAGAFFTVAGMTRRP